MELFVNLFCILINVSITALNIKLYTEYFKDRSARTKEYGEILASEYLKPRRSENENRGG